MFKKSLIFTIILILILGAVVGCSSTEAPKGAENKTAAPAEKQESAKPVNLTIVGGSVGGVWSAITEGVAEAIRREMPAGSSITPKPGKDGPNCETVASGQAEYALSYNVTSFAALNGKEPYKGKVPNVRAVAVLTADNPFQFLVLDKLPINSLDELKAKKYPIKMSVNKQGSTMELSAKAVLAAYGMTYQDIENWGGKVLYQATGDSLAMMKDGKLDAHPNPAESPTAAIVELAMQTPVKILPLNEQAITQINKDLGTMPITLKKGTYSFVKEDIPTFTSALMVITRAETPEDEVYRTVKAIADNIDYLKTVHKSLSTMSIQNMADAGVVPLHPGAEKFYREKGAIK